MPLEELSRHPFDQIKLPSEPSLEGLRAWILKVTDYLGVTPTELARAAQVAPSTVNKFIADTAAVRGLTAKTVRKLFQAASEIHMNKFGNARFQQMREDLVDPAGYATVHVRVATGLRRDVFRKSHLWPVEQQFFVTVMLPNLLRSGRGREESLKEGGLVGMIVADDHAERAFTRSTILVTKPFDPEISVIQPGEFFVVSRANPDGLTELSIREFMVSPSGDMWLLSKAARNPVPDVHVGRAEFEIKYQEGEVFKVAQKDPYNIEYKVILELKPLAREFEALVFPD